MPNQNTLELIVFVGICIVILGFFWKIIVIGITILFCIVVLANHTPPTETKTVAPSVVVQQEVVIEPQKVNDPRREEYVQGCVSYGFTKKSCEDYWDGKIDSLMEI
jgi:hypothetical protein